MNCVLVAGTHGSKATDHEWWMAGSPFHCYLQEQDCDTYSKAVPFIWSTDLVVAGDHSDWKAGGQALYYYLSAPLRPECRIPGKDTHIISHSHGLQVVLYAAKAGLKIDTLVDVSGPFRKDMLPIAEKARLNIRRWLHIHSGCRDWWQAFGGWFDGELGIRRDHPLADVNVCVNDADHTSVLIDPSYFPLWIRNGWFTFLKTGDMVQRPKSGTTAL